MACYFRALSDELVLLIFSQVQRVEPRSMLDVCLVSRQFCRLATPMIYLQVSIPDSKVQTLEPQRGYCFQSNVIAYSRHLTVNWQLDWAALAQLISNMRRLDSLSWAYEGYWNEPFPLEVRKVLTEKWPSANLFIEALPRHLEVATLHGLQNIYSIKITVNGQLRQTSDWMRQLILVICSCKRLEILHIRLPRDEDGFLPFSDAHWPQIDRLVEPGEKLLALKELALDCRVTHDNHAMGLIPLGFWNGTQIRHLELRGPCYFRSLQHLMQGKILRLDTLVIEHFCSVRDYRDVNRILEDFIISTRGLKNLKLLNHAQRIPISTFAHHSSTLERLSILHPRKGIIPGTLYTPAHAYLPEHLDALREACPHLISLALDMKICSEMPYDFLAAIARFPRLERIRIHFRFDSEYLHEDVSNRLPHFQTDLLTVRHMYSFIRSRRTHRRFRLTVVMGHYPRSNWRIGSSTPFRLLTRPIVHFTIFDDENHNIVVEHDALQYDYSVWEEDYFSEARLQRTPGITYPTNLQELIAAGKEFDEAQELIAAEKEFDETMQGVGRSQSDGEVDSLFESP